jgi:hypothetical protein
MPSANIAPAPAYTAPPQQPTTHNPISSAPPPVALPPFEQETHNTADKTATYVARNGKRFEDMVREREGANPKFSFLHELGEGGPYFKWKVWCLQKGFSLQDQDAMMKEAFPEPDAEEQQNFANMLSVLSGSKEHIRALRSWIVAQEEGKACLHWICEQVRTCLTGTRLLAY